MNDQAELMRISWARAFYIGVDLAVLSAMVLALMWGFVPWLLVVLAVVFIFAGGRLHAQAPPEYQEALFIGRGWGRWFLDLTICLAAVVLLVYAPSWGSLILAPLVLILYLPVTLRRLRRRLRRDSESSPKE